MRTSGDLARTCGFACSCTHRCCESGWHRNFSGIGWCLISLQSLSVQAIESFFMIHKVDVHGRIPFRWTALQQFLDLERQSGPYGIFLYRNQLDFLWTYHPQQSSVSPTSLYKELFLALIGALFLYSSLNHVGRLAFLGSLTNSPIFWLTGTTSSCQT